MAYQCNLLFCVFYFLTVSSVSTTDVPCSKVTTEYGFVCKCNDTYCDTITAPEKLKSGKFYHYMTSSESPGFSKTIGKFSSTSQLEPGHSVNNDSTEVHVWLDASVTYQSFKGMGGALTDTSGSLLQSLSPGTLDNAMQSYFGVKGLEYSNVRIAVGSSDFSPSYYTYDDVAGDVDLKYWNLTTEDFTIKIPLIKQAKAMSSRGVKILASPWTAPGWMKTSNTSSQGYLYTKYHQAYAMYLVKFLQAYKDQDLPIWGLTLGNEQVLMLFFGSMIEQGNTIWLPAQHRYWVKKYLGPMIQEAGFGDVKLYALDDERPFLTWSSERLFTDAEYSKYVSGVSLHWYFDWNGTTSQMDLFHKRFPDKSIIYAEASINEAQASYYGNVVALGYWADAARYIEDIYEALCHWSEMYLDWNLVLDTNGGPEDLSRMHLDASMIVNTTSDEFYKQPIFYSMGHFSKFIPPGAQRINVRVKQVSNDSYNEECTAASQELRQRRKTQTKYSSLKLEGLQDLPTLPPVTPSTAVRVLATLNPDGSHTVIVYNPRSEAVKLIVTDSQKGTYKRTLQPLSLNTFLYW